MAEKSLFTPLIDDQYNKYLAELNEYYVLKHDYNEYKKRSKSAKLASITDKEKKIQKFARMKYKCIRCERVGDNREGTIFKETPELLKATCGRLVDYCDLNLEVIRISHIEIYDELSKSIASIADIKKNIIKTKLDFLFGYIEEDKAVELFDGDKGDNRGYKAYLTVAQARFNELLTLYNSITFNKDTEDKIQEKIKEQHELMVKYKEYIESYKITPENQILRDALGIYISLDKEDSTITIKNLDTTIRELKYRDNFIDIGKEVINQIMREPNADVLVQNKYNFSQFEYQERGI